MDIQNIQYQLRRRRLDEIFDFAILVIRTHPGRFLLYALPGMVLFTAINSAIVAALVTEPLEWWSGDNLQAQYWMFVLIVVEQPLFALPLILLNGNLVFNPKPTVRQVFRGTGPLLPRYLLRTALWRTLLYTLLAPLFITVWFGLIRNFFQSEVVLLERLKGSQVRRRLDAISRSWAGRTVGFVLLEIAILVMFLFGALYCWDLVLDTFDLGELPWMLRSRWLFLNPVAHLSVFAFAVIHTTAKFIFYLDIRSMLEGWDIELLMVKGVRDTNG